MTRNEQRFGIIGTIGNGSELRAAPKKKATRSYHVIARYSALVNPETDDPEIAIRYDRDSSLNAGLEWAYGYDGPSVTFRIDCKPILLQEAA